MLRILCCQACFIRFLNKKVFRICPSFCERPTSFFLFYVCSLVLFFLFFCVPERCSCCSFPKGLPLVPSPFGGKMDSVPLWEKKGKTHVRAAKKRRNNKTPRNFHRKAVWPYLALRKGGLLRGNVDVNGQRFLICLRQLGEQSISIKDRRLCDTAATDWFIDGCLQWCLMYSRSSLFYNIRVVTDLLNPIENGQQMTRLFKSTQFLLAEVKKI